MTSELSFDGQCVIVTGAGQQLGRAYALELGRRGAAVVVNDIGHDAGGQATAELVVAEIEAAGGIAVACLESVADEHGPARIAQAALDRFGRIDALINNAGIARFAPLDELSLEELRMMQRVHLSGAFRLTQIAYGAMLRQGYGRIVAMASSSGAFGLENHSAYGSLKMALAALTNVVAVEGASRDICANAVQPRAPLPGRTKESRTQRKLGEFAYRLHPDYSAPMVVYLASRACMSTHRVFSAAAGCYCSVFTGLTDGWSPSGESSPAPSEIGAHLPQIEDPTSYTVPESVEGMLAEVEGEKPDGVASSSSGMLEGRVALVTGVSTRLGREAALRLGAEGAAVLMGDADGSAATAVAAELAAAGGVGHAHAGRLHVEAEAAGLVEAAIERFGRLDVVVHQSGAVGEAQPLQEISPARFDDAVDLHLVGPLLVTKYAFPRMRDQGYGRIVSLCSASGVFGQAGAAADGAARSGVVGLTNVASLEGPAHGVLANTVVAFDGPASTRQQDAAAVASLVAFLASEACTTSRGVWCARSGWYGRVFTGLTSGWVSPAREPARAEEILEHLEEIEDRLDYTVPTIVDEETDAIQVQLERQLGGHADAEGIR